MKKIFENVPLLILIFCFSSCASNRKFDFHSAYKFKTIQYKKAVQGEVEKIQFHSSDESEAQTLIAINNPVMIEPLVPNSKKPQLMVELNKEYKSNGNLLGNLKYSDGYNTITRAEKKQLRKDIRQIIRDIKSGKIDDATLQANIQDKSIAMDEDTGKKKRKIARWLLIGGGVVLITALIIGGIWALGTIGIVAIVAGAVLMLLSLE
jgi:hypothetical protein